MHSTSSVENSWKCLVMPKNVFSYHLSSDNSNLAFRQTIFLRSCYALQGFGPYWWNDEILCFCEKSYSLFATKHKFTTKWLFLFKCGFSYSLPCSSFHAKFLAFYWVLSLLPRILSTLNINHSNSLFLYRESLLHPLLHPRYHYHYPHFFINYLSHWCSRSLQ